MRPSVLVHRLEREPHGLETLRLACEALDRCGEARDTLRAEGAIVGRAFNDVAQQHSRAARRPSEEEQACSETIQLT